MTNQEYPLNGRETVPDSLYLINAFGSFRLVCANEPHRCSKYICTFCTNHNKIGFRLHILLFINYFSFV